MREYLAFNQGLKAPHTGTRSTGKQQEKAATVFVSSNAYYGYQQTHVCSGGAGAPLDIQMDHDYDGSPPARLPCRKRSHTENSTTAGNSCENNDAIQWEKCKKRRENDGGEYSQTSNGAKNNLQSYVNNIGLSSYQANQPYNIANGDRQPHFVQNNHQNDNNHVQNYNHGQQHSSDNVQMEVTQDDCSHNNNNEKRMKNESTQHRGRVKKYRLEEELLRETHGCTYYHWISNNTL